MTDSAKGADCATIVRSLVAVRLSAAVRSSSAAVVRSSAAVAANKLFDSGIKMKKKMSVCCWRSAVSRRKQAESGIFLIF